MPMIALGAMVTFSSLHPTLLSTRHLCSFKTLQLAARLLLLPNWKLQLAFTSLSLTLVPRAWTSTTCLLSTRLTLLLGDTALASSQIWHVANVKLHFAGKPAYVYSVLGANVSNRSFDIPTLGFHLGMCCIFGLYACFFIWLNMFSTLKWLVVFTVFQRFSLVAACWPTLQLQRIRISSSKVNICSGHCSTTLDAPMHSGCCPPFFVFSLCSYVLAFLLSLGWYMLVSMTVHYY
jgi:hypothetical protein